MVAATRPLAALSRWYIYALHGYLCEITFTAIWELVENFSWKCTGYTSIWSFFIYGTAIFVIERLFLFLRTRCNVFVRCLVYTTWIYCWEFSTGFLLKHFNACPWDYSGFYGNFMGLITLEYAVLWFFGSMIAEQAVIINTLQLCFAEHMKQGNVSKYDRKFRKTC